MTSRQISNQYARGKRRPLAVVIVLAVLASLHSPVAAQQPEMSPRNDALQLNAGLAATTLYGQDVELSVRASNTTGTDAYNLTFSVVLPAGVSYVAGSAMVGGDQGPEPRPYQRDGNTTTLVWPNVSDLLAGAQSSIGFAIRPDSKLYDVGDTITVETGGYANSDPRTVPDVDPTTGEVTGDVSVSGLDTASTKLSPFDLRVNEPNVEHELLRGAHDHQTVFTLTLKNNPMQPSTSFEIVTHIPAGLEFLGCGAIDNTADGAVEYPGAPNLNTGAPVLPHPCLDPTSVRTVNTDPDGKGPLPKGIYTRVEWGEAALAETFGSADLEPRETIRFSYVAAVALHTNGEAGSTNPTANLTDNTGALTFDEQTLTTHAIASGNFAGITPSTAEGTEVVMAEDVSAHTSVSDNQIRQGEKSTWTVLIESSEYAQSTGEIVVTETVPDGLDVTASSHSYDRGFPRSNADGTTTLQWTLAGFTAPNGVSTVRYDTVVRTDYRATGLPVMARDSWRSVTALTTTIEVITSDTITGDGSTQTATVTDSSGAAQTAAGIAIAKAVAAPGPDGLCRAGDGLTFMADGAGPFSPGDRVCWRLTVEFPDNLDTGSVVVQDHLPPGFRYDGYQPTGLDTVGGAATLTGNLPVLEWDLGNVDAGGERFDLVIETTIDDPNVAQPADVTANLLKVRHLNTDRSVYQHRDDADILWAEAVVEIDLGIVAVDGVAFPSGAQDGLAVKANNVVTVRAQIDNTAGTIPANDVEARVVLPPSTTCGAISAVSHDGSCSNEGWIDWAGSRLDVAPGGTFDLTFDLTVPEGITADVTLPFDGGVRTYTGPTNTGTAFVYVPSGNIDSTLTPNTGPAGERALIFTPKPSLNIGRATSVAESGNTAANQATIGETIRYTLDLVLPAGTTFYGPGMISNDLGGRLDLDERSLVVAFNGGELPAGWTVSARDNEVVVLFDDAHTVPAAEDQLIEIEFDAVVADVEANTRLAKIPNQVQLDWEDDLGQGKRITRRVNTRVVEPAISIHKAADDSDGFVEPAQEVFYSVTVSNPAVGQVSVAHDVVVVDTVPAELTVLSKAGDRARTGDLVGPDEGRFDASNRTITWTIPSIEAGGSVTVGYEAQVAEPLIASSVITNEVIATATSMAGVTASERTSRSPYGGPTSGYQADAMHHLYAPQVTVTASAEIETATVGEAVDHTIRVTIPADTIAYDLVVMDDLPLGLDFDSVLSVSCTSDADPCEQPLTTPSVLDGGHDVAFFIGDASVPASTDRTVTIQTRSFVRDHYSVFQGGALSTSATVRHNASNRIRGQLGGYPWVSTFDHIPSSDSVAVVVVEPSISIDKTVVGQLGDTDFRRAVPGETLTYSITVANDGGTTVSPAYNIVVTDAIDERLLSLNDQTAPGGVVPLDSDLTDGTLSWEIEGPLPAGQSATITYDVTIPADWNSEQEVPTWAEVLNTADVEHHYGVDANERSGNVDRAYRRYTQVRSDTVAVELDLASIAARVWIDEDRDETQDTDEVGAVGVDVTAVYHGPDGAYQTADDEVYRTITGDRGVWSVGSLPGGRYTVLVDLDDLPSGMTPTFDLDHDRNPEVVWTGWLTQSQDRVDLNAGYAAPALSDGSGYDTSSQSTDSLGNVWVVGTKPDGRAYVRTRSPEGSWSSWIPQGTGDWASMSIHTDRAGALWVVGVKTSGVAYVRTKDTSKTAWEGWSQWVSQGSGGWASMSMATDPSGAAWLVGVKTNGTAYVRTKASQSPADQGWSSWVHQGSKKWASVALATDTSGNVWLSGVTTDGKAYVRNKLAGGGVKDTWSWWKRQSNSTDWVSMNLATDSYNNLWVVGVKESGTAYLRQKTVDESIHAGWTGWHQLGSGGSWASMTLTVDDADTLWVAGVKHSGTGYIAMKCYCPGISEGWSRWWQQGSVNSWHSLTISTDPSNRVMLTGLKLDGSGYVRFKGPESGVSTAWTNWSQHGTRSSWATFDPHSNAWTGIQPTRTPSLGVEDIEWINLPGWTVDSLSVNDSGTRYWC